MTAPAAYRMAAHTDTCRTCGAAIIRAAADPGQPRPPWLHTNLAPQCRTWLGEWLPTVAAPLVLFTLPAPPRRRSVADVRRQW